MAQLGLLAHGRHWRVFINGHCGRSGRGGSELTCCHLLARCALWSQHEEQQAQETHSSHDGGVQRPRLLTARCLFFPFERDDKSEDLQNLGGVHSDLAAKQASEWRLSCSNATDSVDFSHDRSWGRVRCGAVREAGETNAECRMRGAA